MKHTEWKQYLIEQAVRHPSIQPQDTYKLIFQAVFGAEHLLQDKVAAYDYFQKEYERVVPKEEALWEQIGHKVYRMNLGAWKKRNLPAKWLFQMFVGSVERGETLGAEAFWQYVEEAKEVVKEAVFSFSYEEFLQYAIKYEKTGPKAVHHSEAYRAAEQPSYRLVSGEYIRLLPILERIAALMNHQNEKVVVAIDGRCASGKSTMAGMLSDVAGVSVVHMDDFYLPKELRTKERLEQPGGNVHYERFQEEVLAPLKLGETFSYRRFDCSRMELGETQKVPKASIYVVEGAYSCHPCFGEYADVKVFSDIESKEQLRRISQRDGQECLSMFRERWIPMEENYFATYLIKEAADVIV